LSFHAQALPLPSAIAIQVRQFTWHPGCPIPLEKLAYLRLRHYGYDGRIHDGELIIHQELAVEVIKIFHALFQIRFPIEKMHLVDVYKGNDDASMADNNTSAFNCRDVTGKPGVFSQHAFGRAIDINPMVNPYVINGQIIPPGSKVFLENSELGQGSLRQGSLVIKFFMDQGWFWGGNFKNLKDYQHFEKITP
jgi:hypothetical protein